MQQFTAVYATVKRGYIASVHCAQFPAESLTDAYERAEEQVEDSAGQLLMVVEGGITAYRKGGLVTTVHGT